MGKYDGLTGKRFNSWTVIGTASSRNGVKYFECRCSCGNIKEVNGYSLVNGLSTQCVPCSNRHTESIRDFPEYRIRLTMIQRCTNPTATGFANYGGRGIRVSERWLDKKVGYENFLTDLGRRPSPNHLLEREDNDGHYEPGNVRWATRNEQMRNTRRTRRIKYRGRDRVEIEVSEELGVSRYLIGAAGEDIDTEIDVRVKYGKRSLPRTPDSSRMSLGKIKEIKRLLGSYEPKDVSVLAEVSLQTVYNIRNGKIYSDISEFD